MSPYRRAAGVPRNGTNKLYERATIVRRQAELRVTPHTHCYAPGITSGLLQMHLELHAEQVEARQIFPYNTPADLELSTIGMTLHDCIYAAASAI